MKRQSVQSLYDEVYTRVLALIAKENMKLASGNFHVDVEPIPGPVCPVLSTQCTHNATMRVSLSFETAGVRARVADYCKACAPIAVKLVIDKLQHRPKKFAKAKSTESGKRPRV